MKLRIPIGIVSALCCGERRDEQQLVPREQERVDEGRDEPGRAFGSTMRKNAPNGVQPSTIAASSSSRGIARKNERMK